MTLNERDLFGEVANSLITVTPPSASKKVYLASPPVGTWIDLVKEVQAYDNKTPDTSTVTKCVAACMVDENGNPIDDGTLRSTLAKANPYVVMWLYKKCWDTVLKVDLKSLEAMEGN